MNFLRHLTAKTNKQKGKVHLNSHIWKVKWVNLVEGYYYTSESNTRRSKLGACIKCSLCSYAAQSYFRLGRTQIYKIKYFAL